MTTPVDQALPAEDGPARALGGEVAVTGRTPLVIKLLVTATFVVILNETIMGNAIPRLMADFEVSTRAAQWLTTIFLLTMAAVIPITGWFLQRVTTRQAYGLAMAVFCAGTAVCAAAPVFEVLLLGRMVQAAGTAVMMPLLMTTLMTVVPAAERGRVMGNVTLAMSVAPAMGPAVSGIVLGLGSWRLIFLLVLPVAAIVAVLGLRQLPDIGEPTAGAVDWLSVSLAGTGFAALVYGLSEIGGDSVAVPLVSGLAGALLVAAFVRRQLVLQRTGTPLLDLRTLTHRTYVISLLVMSVGFMAMLGAMILLPLYLQDARGLSALRTGLLVMPGGLAMGLLGPRVGGWYDRFGSRPLVIPGAVAILVGLGVLSQIGTETPYAVLLGAHVVMMMGLAFVFTPVFTLGLGALPPHLYPHGSSILGTIQQVAGAVGTAAVVVIADIRSRQLIADGVAQVDAFVGGLRWAFLAGAVAAVLVVALAALLPSKVESAEGAPAVH